jgi:hypothetical protein
VFLRFLTDRIKSAKGCKSFAAFFLIMILLLGNGCNARGVGVPLGFAESFDLGYQYIQEASYQNLVGISKHIIEMDGYCPSGYIGYAIVWLSVPEKERALSVLNISIKGMAQEYKQAMEELIIHIQNDDYTREIGLDVFRRCSDYYLESLNKEEIPDANKATLYKYIDGNGNLCYIQGKLDAEGRKQGFCVVNTIDLSKSEVIYIGEAEFVDDLEEGYVKELWAPMDSEGSSGLDFGVMKGVYKNGEMSDGFVDVKGYEYITRPAVVEGEIARIDDCVVSDAIYSYEGLCSNGIYEDSTGDAHEMWVDPTTNRRVEYIGQFEGGLQHGRGRIWDDRGWSFEGRFVNDEPYDYN